MAHPLKFALIALALAACARPAAPTPDAHGTAAIADVATGPTLAEGQAATAAFVRKCYANLHDLQFKHVQVHVMVDPHGEIKFAQLPRQFGWGWISACVERAVMTTHLAVDLAGAQTLEYDIGP